MCSFVGAKFLAFVGAIALSSGVLMSDLPARAGEFIADTKSGCQIWNPHPQLEETVSWSGPCAQGRAEGRGIAQWLKKGVPYETDEGEWREGHQAGAGVQSWSGGQYRGELAAGEPNGHGVLVMEKLRYEGEFRDGKPNGFGELTAGTELVRGNWKDGCLQGPRKASIGVPLWACR